jgi:hypothetical protein
MPKSAVAFLGSAGAAIVAVLLVASCASEPRAAGGAKAPAQPAGPAPTTIEGAQADIAHWQAVLGVGVSTGTGGAAVPAPPPTPPGTASGSADQATTPGAAAPPPPTPAAPPQGYEPSAQAGSSADTCATPCQAIASMRRSVGVLCDLTGEDDSRCKDARRVLADSEQRVSPCGC